MKAEMLCRKLNKVDISVCTYVRCYMLQLTSVGRGVQM